MTLQEKAREWAKANYGKPGILQLLTDAYIAGAAGSMEWVPVAEKLPEKNGYYICWLDDPSEHGLIHYHTSAGWQNGFYNDRVTHWFYLIPPHPEKEQL